MSQRIAYLFPGQGSQVVGMGQDLYTHHADVKTLFDTVNTLIQANEKGQSLLNIMFEGTSEELNRTLYTQPAILAVSLACWQAFRSQVNLSPVAVAGHSLGEFSALVAADVLSLEDVVPIVERRASLMEKAPKGAMSAVLGLSAEAVREVIANFSGSADGLVVVANDNSPAQVVISGTASGIEAITPLLKDAKAKRVLPLPVGGAFHSPLMEVPARHFEAVLASADFQKPNIPVLSNVSAIAQREASALKADSIAQMCHSVEWVKTMRYLVEDLNVDTVIEFGPGKVLTGLMKKTFPNVMTYNIFDVESLNETLAVFQNEVANV